MIRIAPHFPHPPLDIGVERLSGGQVARRAKDDLSRFSGKLPARVGLTGLNDDGPSLWGAGDIKRTPYGQFSAFMVEGMQLRRVEEGTAFDIADKGVVVEAIHKPVTTS